MRRQTAIIVMTVAALCACSVEAKPTEKKKEATPDVVAYNEGVELMKKKKYARASRQQKRSTGSWANMGGKFGRRVDIS